MLPCYTHVYWYSGGIQRVTRRHSEHLNEEYKQRFIFLRVLLLTHSWDPKILGFIYDESPFLSITVKLGYNVIKGT
jgi:hypothetical protein